MSLRIILAVVVVGMVARAGMAQVIPPFFGGGAVAIDPEIDVVPTGVVMATQATVSHDLRYVTLTIGAQQTQLLNLFEVRFPAGMVGGFVGGANLGTVAFGPAGPAGAGPAAAESGPRAQGTSVGGSSAPETSPRETSARGTGILERQGMSLVRPLQER